MRIKAEATLRNVPTHSNQVLIHLLLIINEVIKIDLSVRAYMKTLVPRTNFCFIKPQISLGHNGKLNFRRQWILKPTKPKLIMFTAPEKGHCFSPHV